MLRYAALRTPPVTGLRLCGLPFHTRLPHARLLLRFAHYLPCIPCVAHHTHCPPLLFTAVTRYVLVVVRGSYLRVRAPRCYGYGSLPVGSAIYTAHGSLFALYLDYAHGYAVTGCPRTGCLPHTLLPVTRLPFRLFAPVHCLPLLRLHYAFCCGYLYLLVLRHTVLTFCSSTWFSWLHTRGYRYTTACIYLVRRLRCLRAAFAHLDILPRLRCGLHTTPHLRARTRLRILRVVRGLHAVTFFTHAHHRLHTVACSLRYAVPRSAACGYCHGCGSPVTVVHTVAVRLYGSHVIPYAHGSHLLLLVLPHARRIRLRLHAHYGSHYGLYLPYAHLVLPVTFVWFITRTTHAHCVRSAFWFHRTCHRVDFLVTVICLWLPPPARGSFWFVLRLLFTLPSSHGSAY